MSKKELEESVVKYTKRITNVKKEKVILKYQSKKELDYLSDELASILDFRNKDGIADGKQISNTVLKKAICIYKEEMINKVSIEADLIDTLIKEFKEHQELSDSINRIIEKEKELKNKTSDLKIIKKEFQLTEDEYKELEENDTDEKALFSFTNEVSKDVVSEYEEKQKEKYKKEKGEKERKKKETKEFNILNKEMIKLKVKSNL